MDSACISSGESSIDFLEAHPHVRRIGQPTAGQHHFGDVGSILLTHSKITVRVPTTYNSYRDGRWIERTGIRPDPALPDGVDALTWVLDRI